MIVESDETTGDGYITKGTSGLIGGDSQLDIILKAYSKTQLSKVSDNQIQPTDTMDVSSMQQGQNNLGETEDQTQDEVDEQVIQEIVTEQI
ncbi:MAG: hypothetical protein ACK5HR_02920 [Mycoplasmatales bacterium]